MKLSSSTLTGKVTRKYSTADTTTIKASGKSYAGSIGVFGKQGGTKKGINTAKNSGIGIEKKKVVATTTKKTPVNGKKKTWTGPKITDEDVTLTAGGFTEWTRDPNGNGTLQKYTCQTVTTTKAMGSDD